MAAREGSSTAERQDGRVHHPELNQAAKLKQAAEVKQAAELQQEGWQAAARDRHHPELNQAAKLNQAAEVNQAAARDRHLTREDVLVDDALLQALRSYL